MRIATRILMVCGLFIGAAGYSGMRSVPPIQHSYHGGRSASVRLAASKEPTVTQQLLPPLKVRQAFDAISTNDLVKRKMVRKVLAEYGVNDGANSVTKVMKAYTGDADGALGINEFSQLISVLEASREAQKGLTSSSSNELGARIGDAAYETVGNLAKTLVNIEKTVDERREPGVTRRTEEEQVTLALKRMQRDMSMLDLAAGATPQLSPVELVILSSTVGVAFFSPYAFSAKVVEVLVPSCTALVAAIGFSAEYIGKVAVSRGKEVAATTLQAAAEAELYLAQAERAKAIIPLCVGIGATAAAFSLLAPALVADLAAKGFGIGLATEVYLFSPLIAVLAASVAALAAQESLALANRAIGVGARRFASSTEVGRTWLSQTEQITANTERAKQKWTSFSLGVLPAPLLAILLPGTLSFKAIVAAATAAAQAAYSLARAEYTLSAAVESVALKSRSAAIADTYANQGARAGAILPFTSALSGLAAATTVAVVEVLPLIGTPFGESLVCVVFPALGALIAAAASISKARCEVDATAATAAATQLASVKGQERDPFRATAELIQLTIKAVRTSMTPRSIVRWLRNKLSWLLRLGGADGPRAAAV